jgi:hypothetical protein
MLKGILKNRKFQLNHEIEEAIALARDGLTFGPAQSVFHN